VYREKIDKFIDAHKTEMLEDIAELCKIDSTKDSYRAGRPYGDGCFEALGAALHIAECYGFSINNYDNYVGTVDLNDKEKQLDILAHLDIVPAGDGWTVTEPFVPIRVRPSQPSTPCAL
jgi:succinyl-diaminopimelate desuccinylase